MADADDLFETIMTGDTDRLAEIVTADPRLAGARNDAGLSAVTVALYHRRDDAVRVLLEHSPPLDPFEAAALGREDMIDRAIEDGVDWSVTSADGFTPLHLASFFARSSVVLRLIAAGANVDAVATNGSNLRPIHSAAASGSHEIVRALLAAGADANARQVGGFTALHAAAHRGDDVLCRILLDAGADRALTTEAGKTARDLVPPHAAESLGPLL